MNKRILYLFLDALEKKESLEALLKKNISYIEIGKATSFAIREGYIVDSTGGFLLTEIGIGFLSTFKNSLKVKKKSEWIGEEISSKTDKLSKNDVYLPNQNDLCFS